MKKVKNIHINDLPLPLFVINENYKVDYVNKAFVDLTGYSKSKLNRIVISEYSKRKAPDAAVTFEDFIETELKKLKPGKLTKKLFCFRRGKECIPVKIKQLDNLDLKKKLFLVDDFTERIKNEEKLNKYKNENKYKEISLEVINKISQKLNSNTGIEEIRKHALILVQKYFNSPFLTLHKIDTKSTLSLINHIGHFPNLKRMIEKIPVKNTYSGKIYINRKVGIINNIGNTKLISTQFKEELLKHNFSQIISIPLYIKEEKIGVINLYYKEERKIFSEEIKSLETIGKTVSLKIINADYYQKLQKEIKTRKEKEKEVKKNNILQDATLESINYALLIYYYEDSSIRVNNNMSVIWVLNNGWAKLKTSDELFENMSKKILEPTGFLKDTQVYLQKKQKIGYEKLQLKDGRILEGSVSPLKIKNKIIGKVFSYQDVTEKNRIEDRLLATKKMTDKIISNVSDTLWSAEIVNSGQFNYTYLSQNIERITGYKLSDFNEGIEFWEKIIHNEDVVKWKTAYNSIIDKSKSTVLTSYRIIKKDGSTTWIQDKMVGEFISRSKLFIYGNLSDITEKMRTEEALEESRQLLELFFKQTLDGIYFMILDEPVNWKIEKDKEEAILYVMDHERITKVNNALAEQYGTTKEKLLGLTPREMLRENFDIGKEGWTELYDLGSKKTITEEYKIDGTPIWIEGYYNCIYTNDGLIRGHFGIQRDITKRKQIEQEFIKEKERAEESSNLKSEFLAQMSHEIRSPINTILSYASLIEEEVYDAMDEDMRIGFSMMNKAADRIVRTINMLLSMSELQTGTYKYQGKYIDFYYDILLELFMEYNQKAKLKGLEMKIENKSINTKIYADEFTVTQVLTNLFDNSLKYTNEGSINIFINDLSKDKLQVIIQDTGIGISEEYLPKIFDPFTQENQGSKRTYEGNGLGLALVKKYCELNNSEIKVESKKNEGTRVKILFNKKNK